MTHLLTDISISPDFNGLPPSVYQGLVHLTNNAAALLGLVAGLGIVVSLIGLVAASWTSNHQLSERSKSGLALSISAIALLYIGVGAANYAGHLFS